MYINIYCCNLRMRGSSTDQYIIIQLVAIIISTLLNKEMLNICTQAHMKVHVSSGISLISKNRPITETLSHFCL